MYGSLYDFFLSQIIYARLGRELCYVGDYEDEVICDADDPTGHCGGGGVCGTFYRLFESFPVSQGFFSQFRDLPLDELRYFDAMVVIAAAVDVVVVVFAATAFIVGVGADSVAVASCFLFLVSCFCFCCFCWCWYREGVV